MGLLTAPNNWAASNPSTALGPLLSAARLELRFSGEGLGEVGAASKTFPNAKKNRKTTRSATNYPLNRRGAYEKVCKAHSTIRVGFVHLRVGLPWVVWGLGLGGIEGEEGLRGQDKDKATARQP